METITIKGVAQESGKQITGYKFPPRSEDFPIPSTILFAPNYGAILYEKDGKQSKANPRSVNIVGRLASSLLTDNGLILNTYDPLGKYMLIATNSVTVGDSTQPTITTTNTTSEDVSGANDTVKSVFGLIGLIGFVYIAHKKKKGTWGYIGFGLLGLIVGNIVGGQVSKLTKK